MKAFTICTAVALFALAHAAPLEAKPRQFLTDVIFQGAPPEDAFFTQSFPVDGTVIIIGMFTFSSCFLLLPLLTSLPFPSLPTSFQVSASASAAYPSARRQSPSSPFFHPELPSNPQNSDDPLSISHIEVVDGVFCTFNGIDGSITVVQGPDTVDVGPPQTQVSGQCFDFVE